MSWQPPSRWDWMPRDRRASSGCSSPKTADRPRPSPTSDAPSTNLMDQTRNWPKPSPRSTWVASGWNGHGPSCHEGRESPDDGRPYLLLTEVGTRTGDNAQAVLAYYREALRRDSSLAPAHFGLADLLRSLHRYAQAADEYDCYLALRPNDPMGNLGAGLNAVAKGESERATEWLGHALQLAPTDPAIHSALAEQEIADSRPDRALDYCNRSVQADPFDPQVRYRRMLVLNRLGRSDEARKEGQSIEHLRAERAEFDRISEALVRSPTDPELRARAATWLILHGREFEAID